MSNLQEHRHCIVATNGIGKALQEIHKIAQETVPERWYYQVGVQWDNLLKADVVRFYSNAHIMPNEIWTMSGLYYLGTYWSWPDHDKKVVQVKKRGK